jgi:two-component system OmpR family response regulator/two-component system copper resistance phosphate regulon response regulator CusR
MQELGALFTHQLCERVWHRNYDYNTRTVEIFITRLRKKSTGLSDRADLTVRSVGYAVRLPEAGADARARAARNER